MKSLSLLALATLLGACAPDSAPFADPVDPDASERVRPQLSLSEPFLRQGEPFTLVATGAPAGSTVRFAASPRRGTGPTVAPGVTLGLINPVVLGSAVADAGGVATLESVAPDTVPIGARVFLQAATSAGNLRPSPVVATEVVEDVGVFGTWEVPVLGLTIEVDNTEVRSDLLGDHTIIRHDNARGSIVARNGAGTLVPGAYTRFDWVVAGSAVFGCVGVDDAPTARAALTTSPSDPTDLTSGCPGTTLWFELVPQAPALEGLWFDNFGTDHDIDADVWLQSSPFFTASWTVTHYSNLDGWMVAQNDASNGFFPGAWSRFDHTTDPAGDVYYCQTAFAAASEYEARTTPPADPSDLAAGCGGFSWSAMTPVP